MKLKNLKLYTCIKEVGYYHGRGHISRYKRRRNTEKVVRIYLNGKEQGYIFLDNLHRNLHIKTGDENLEIKSDY